MNVSTRKTSHQRRWYFPLAAGLLAVATLAGCGRPPEARDQVRAEKVHKYATFRVNDVLDDLDATDQQRERVHAIKDKVLGEGLALRKNMKETRAQLLAAWRSEKPDKAQLHALVDKRIEELRGFLKGAADSLVDVHDTLTPEQREEIATLIEERMARHEH